jgi:hypothetical protein
MKTAHFNALIDFISSKISLAEFLTVYPVDPRENMDHVCDLLRSAIDRQNKEEVEAALISGHRIGEFTSDCVPLLNELITANWHISHEDIAEALQILKDQRSTDALYKAAHLNLDYMGGDEGALGVKCCWALSAIDNADADQRLRELAHSNNLRIATAARDELRRKSNPTK